MDFEAAKLSKNIENVENNSSVTWIRRKELENMREPTHSGHNLDKTAFHAKSSRRRKAADDFDGKVLRRVSGQVALEYSRNKKRKECSGGIIVSSFSTKVSENFSKHSIPIPTSMVVVELIPVAAPNPVINGEN